MVSVVQMNKEAISNGDHVSDPSISPTEYDSNYLLNQLSEHQGNGGMPQYHHQEGQVNMADMVSNSEANHPLHIQNSIAAMMAAGGGIGHMSMGHHQLQHQSGGWTPNLGQLPNPLMSSMLGNNSQQLAAAMMIAQAQRSHQVNQSDSMDRSGFPSLLSMMPTHRDQQQGASPFGMSHQLMGSGQISQNTVGSMDSRINNMKSPSEPLDKEATGNGGMDEDSNVPTRKRKDRPLSDDAENRRMHCWNCSPDCPNRGAGPARHHVAGMCGRCHQKWQKHPCARWAVTKCVSKCRCARCEVSRNPEKARERRPRIASGTSGLWADEEGLAQAAALAAATNSWEKVVEPLDKECRGNGEDQCEKGQNAGTKNESLVHSLVRKMVAQLAVDGVSDDSTMLAISSLVGRPCVVGHRMPEGITHFSITSDPQMWPLALKVAAREGMPDKVAECNPAAALVLTGQGNGKKGPAMVSAAASAQEEVIGRRFENIVALKSLPFAVAACVQCHLMGTPQALAAVHLKNDTGTAPMGRQMLVLPALEKRSTSSKPGEELHSRFLFPGAESADSSGFLVVFGPPAQAPPESFWSGNVASQDSSPTTADPSTSPLEESE